MLKVASFFFFYHISNADRACPDSSGSEDAVRFYRQP